MNLSYQEFFNLANKVKDRYKKSAEGKESYSHDDKVRYYATKAIESLEKEVRLHLQAKYK